MPDKAKKGALRSSKMNIAIKQQEEVLFMNKNNENEHIKQVAIACQGGGSHTAFIAGVLKKILKEQHSLKEKGYEIGALSGTSGGAICALLAWSALLTDNGDKGVELLDSFWQDNAANSFWEMLLNEWMIWLSRISTPEISPYFYPPWAKEHLKKILVNHVDFEKIKQLLVEEFIEKSRPVKPMLFVGAVEVRSGQFKVFKNVEITTEAILASAAIPSLFRAVWIGKELYWDGLFSQNPPIRNFVQDIDFHEKPDEIWVIQIEPQTREKEPTSIEEIKDRRSELAGNLSLNQEKDFIKTVNKWLEKGFLPSDKYKLVEIKEIKMGRDLDYSSKLDRSPSFIYDLMAYGEEQAENFLKQLP